MPTFTRAALLQVAMSSAGASAWLSCRLQVMAAALVAAVAGIAAAGAKGWLALGSGPVPAGLVGLSLAYALPIVGKCTQRPSCAVAACLGVHHA